MKMSKLVANGGNAANGARGGDANWTLKCGGAGGFGGGGGGCMDSSSWDHPLENEGQGGRGGQNGSPELKARDSGAGGEHGAAGACGVRGSLTVEGGTVEVDVIGDAVTINGGCVKAGKIERIPKNGAGDDFHCVIVEGIGDQD